MMASSGGGVHVSALNNKNSDFVGAFKELCRNIYDMQYMQILEKEHRDFILEGMEHGEEMLNKLMIEDDNDQVFKVFRNVVMILTILSNYVLEKLLSSADDHLSLDKLALWYFSQML